MYGMGGRNKKACEACKRPSCINPQICATLNTAHSKLLEIYRAVDALPYIKKSFIGSGVRYDLLLHQSKDEHSNQAAREYTRELIVNHVSGRLKVAPEHTCPSVLKLMRKPPFEQFSAFKNIFEKITAAENLRQQIIPYFISSHPGCQEEDMAELAVLTKQMDFHLEQVQDFTPTPMTVSTETWYTGYDPYTLEPVFSAHTPKEKLAQRMFFFWYKPEERRNIENELRRIGRADLIPRLYDHTTFTPNYKNRADEEGRKSFSPNFRNGKIIRSYSDQNTSHEKKIQQDKNKVYQGRNKKYHDNDNAYQGTSNAYQGKNKTYQGKKQSQDKPYQGQPSRRRR